ncbi:hypothetical protein [Ruminiclostridium cellobioparum]|uniref:hypothetical protein n=1 Tax=Ruminiclostridium cellobioparum TaxID=29355 RepID=UPI0028AB3B28|nr:hypothetical protein [Ruminiclostridium cellobioparum]
MKNELKDKINYIIEYNAQTSMLLGNILNSGETMIIGGALREFKDNALTKIPRDIDIVVDTDDNSLSKILLPYNSIKNRFGGYKIIFNNFIIDIWCLKNTWAFKERKIKCAPNEYSSRLQDTVFLNIDAIVYNLTKDIWYDEKYMEAVNTGILDVVLIENPQLALNIVRTILLRQKYSMQLSDCLRQIISNFVFRRSGYLPELMEAQLSHYKNTLISCTDMEKEIQSICRN